MSRDYFDRYQFFIEEGNFKIVPGIELPIKGTDKYHNYKKGKTRLDKVSQDYYGTPVFGWLILQANPELRQAYEAKKVADKEFANSEWQQLYYIYQHSVYFEPSYMLLPVYELK